MNDALLDRIEALAGKLRGKTFRAAAEFILEHGCKTIVETGCYRGNPADGQSTLILALLAKEIGGTLSSFDISKDSVERAVKLLGENGIDSFVYSVRDCDSLAGLSCLVDWDWEEERFIRFAYLDSLDYEADNPGPCQRHELAEIGAIIGKMQPPCAILLDDCIADTGGKTLLGAQFLKDRGWALAAEGYQLMFTKMV